MYGLSSEYRVLDIKLSILRFYYLPEQTIDNLYYEANKTLNNINPVLQEQIETKLIQI